MMATKVLAVLMVLVVLTSGATNVYAIVPPNGAVEHVRSLSLNAQRRRRAKLTGQAGKLTQTCHYPAGANARTRSMLRPKMPPYKVRAEPVV